MGEWFAYSPVASWLRTFVAVMLSAAVADWTTDGVISVDNWRTWLTAGAVSVIPVIVRWLNPVDGSFGRMSND